MENCTSKRAVNAPKAIKRQQLVNRIAAQLRDHIFQREPGTYIGSLTDVARTLGVGIVTVQQAARILEQEALLVARRGPGGGYYGTRPDNTALERSLERSLEAYWRVHGFDFRDSQRMLALLDCEIMPTAACCQNDALIDFDAQAQRACRVLRYTGTARRV